MIKRLLKFERVDGQVFICTMILVIISCLVISLLSYTAAYNDMILSLQERVESIYSYMENDLDKETFKNLNIKEDIAKESYLDMNNDFLKIKEVTGVQYLYTAKINAEGQYIYVVDGLPLGSSDFRYPGDIIEPEIISSLAKALNNEAVMPSNIKSTDWGYIFISYLPIHDGNQVIGAIGIEFSAEHQYKTFLFLRTLLPCLILFMCVVSAFISIKLFKRISNPGFKDLANSDYLTMLKSRNAYEIDIQNIYGRKKKKRFKDMTIIVVDLNDLKKINDAKGHEVGDLYLKAMAQALICDGENNKVVYRVGGDEFVVVYETSKIEEVEEYLKKVKIELLEKVDFYEHASFAYGYAVADVDSREEFIEMSKIADEKMYENKKSMKGEKKK